MTCRPEGPDQSHPTEAREDMSDPDRTVRRTHLAVTALLVAVAAGLVVLTWWLDQSRRVTYLVLLILLLLGLGSFMIRARPRL